MTLLLEFDFIPLFIINLVSTLVLLRGIYFRYSANRDTLFGLLMFANGVFLVTYFLHNIEMSMGFAFGLFAVFSMLRYRTESLNIRDMTYLFLVIVMSLMTAVSKLELTQLVFINGLLCCVALLAETQLLATRIYEKTIKYETIENIRPENHHRLIDDLAIRTGLVIQFVEIGNIDFLRDVAELKVYYSKPHHILNQPERGANTPPSTLLSERAEFGN